MVESIAKVRNIRVTPQKARRIVDVIRGKQAAEALAVLKFAPCLLYTSPSPRD